jgi:hypothetical protein
MTQPRYNVFNLIHKGLRHFMYDTALKIQKADFTAPASASVIAQLEEMLGYFEQHAHHEDNHVLPPVQQHNAALVDDFEAQHVEDHRLGHELQQTIEQWKKAGSADEKRLAGRTLFYLFNEFIAFNLYHMNKEEKEINDVLWTNYADADLMQITQRIIADIQPAALMAQSRWMMRSINRQELLGWLGGMKATAPAPVVKMFAEMAQQELPLEQWLEVKTLLFEDAVMA